MNLLTDWNCHLLPMMGEWIASPWDAREAIIRLHARTGIRRFCMMAEFDCLRESLPCFLLQRDRAMRELTRTLPQGVRAFAGGYLRLRPRVSELVGLMRLKLPRLGLLPVLLPWNGMTQEEAHEWNQLLYHTPARPLIMETDHYITRFPSEAVDRLLGLDAVYQFNYLSLKDPRVRGALRKLMKRGATVLFGTGVNSPGGAGYYDFRTAIEAAEADFGKETLAELLTMKPTPVRK
ncbi:MAG TPA: hypothetical protein DDW30_08940 [Clostridiales bacterium]|nr:hypothetical protein [Clostridiales bacterium]